MLFSYSGSERLARRTHLAVVKLLSIFPLNRSAQYKYRRSPDDSTFVSPYIYTTSFPGIVLMNLAFDMDVIKPAIRLEVLEELESNVTNV